MDKTNDKKDTIHCILRNNIYLLSCLSLHSIPSPLITVLIVKAPPIHPSTEWKRLVETENKTEMFLRIILILFEHQSHLNLNIGSFLSFHLM